MSWMFLAVLRIHEIVVPLINGSGCGPDPDADLDPVADPDSAIFVSDLQDLNKKLFFFRSFFAYYFLKVHLNHFPQR
jgi:hypothetical protein